MTLTQKGTRATAAAATAEDILKSYPKTVASGKKEKEDEENLESKKRDRAITEWISRPSKLPSHNEDKEYEDEIEYVGAHLASTDPPPLRQRR